MFFPPTLLVGVCIVLTPSQTMSRAKHLRPQAPAAASAYTTSLPSTRQVPSLAELDALYASYAEHARYVEQKSPATVRQTRSMYYLFRRFLADTTLDEPHDIRVTDITGWLVWLQKANPNLSKVTLNAYYRGLRPFFRYLAATTHLPDPFLSRRPPKLPKDRTPRALRPNDTARVLNTARDYPWRNEFSRTRAVAIISAMALGGLRKGEVLRLLLQDVDLASGRIDIRDSKGDKCRMVYMPRELRVAFASYLDARAHRSCQAFFVSKNNRALSDSQLRRLIRMIGQAAGVKFFAHALRHSYITLLLKSRVPLHIVQSLAGHADLETTQRYTALWDDEKRAAVQKVRLTNRY